MFYIANSFYQIVPLWNIEAFCFFTSVLNFIQTKETDESIKLIIRHLAFLYIFTRHNHLLELVLFLDQKLSIKLP
jgi:hypothetical protein